MHWNDTHWYIKKMLFEMRREYCTKWNAERDFRVVKKTGLWRDSTKKKQEATESLSFQAGLVMLRNTYPVQFFESFTKKAWDYASNRTNNSISIANILSFFVPTVIIESYPVSNGRTWFISTWHFYVHIIDHSQLQSGSFNV